MAIKKCNYEKIIINWFVQPLIFANDGCCGRLIYV